MFESKRLLKAVADLSDQVSELKKEIYALKQTGVIVDTKPFLDATGSYWPDFNRYKTIPIDEVVRKILEHLDLTLTYKAGTPEHTELTKKMAKVKAK